MSSDFSLTSVPSSLPVELEANFESSYSVIGYGAYAVVLKINEKTSPKRSKACKMIAHEPLASRGLLAQL